MRHFTALALVLASWSAVAEEPVAPQLTKPPTLVTFVEAPYPESERAAGKAATVTLRLTLEATGAVSEAEIVESAGQAFDEAARTAALAFVFSPAEIDGVPASVRILYAYEFVLKDAPPLPATLVGVVRDRGTKKPLPEVDIRLDDGRTAHTAADGAFTFDALAAGTIGLTLSGPRLTTLRTEEILEAGQRLEVRYDVTLQPVVQEEDGPVDELEIVVVAPPLRRQLVATAVVADDARRVPGTSGDVLKVVDSMPGVGRAAVGSGNLVVWGAAPEETRVYVDGVPVPRLYHQGGLRSVVHSDLVKGVELVPGGYGAAYGRGLGGIVTVETRQIDDGLHASVSADLYDASAAVRAPLSKDVHVAAAARYGYLHALGGLVVSEEVQQYFPFPRYADAQAKLLWNTSPSSKLELSVLHSRDAVSKGVPSADPARAVLEERSQSFTRIAARWLSDGADGTRIVVTPWFGLDHASQQESVGAIATRLESTVQSGGVRASWRNRPLAFLTVEAGLDAELSFARDERNGSMGAPAREGDVRVFGQPPPEQMNADDWETVSVGVAPYVEADVALFADRLHLLPGLRADPYARSINRRFPREGESPDMGLFLQEFTIEPRLAVRFDAHERLSLRAALGSYAQPPRSADLSSVFGSPELPIATAAHRLVGVAWKATGTLTVEATGFLSTQQSLTVRSPLPSPLRVQALVGAGEGRAYGGQLMLRQGPVHGLFGWISYGLLRSERRNADGTWRLFDYDQTHLLTAVASYDLGNGFDVGVRARLATGFPRTPVIGSIFDASTDSTQPIFGAQNSERIPVFVQVDARVAKRWTLPVGELDLSLELQNLTNRANAEEIVYSPDFSESGYVTGLPFLAVLGARWTM